MVNDILLNDKISRVITLAERAMMLAEDCNDYMVRTSRGQIVLEGDTNRAIIVTDMLLEVIAEMQGELEKLDTMTTPAKEPTKDHQDMSKTERVDEILNQIGVFAGMIENFPDWLDRMKKLNFTASCLAMGCKDYDFSCKEPGRD